ncbi:MAG: hypothetical protein E7315_06620 [Clostridiales bacterium]|nr:hypothetical protein [Clostridiales bacterium]
MNKKFTPREIVIMSICILPPLMVFMMPSFLAVRLNHDGWIQYIIYMLLDVLLCIVICSCFRKSSTGSLEDMCKTAFGKVFSKVVLGLFSALFVYKTAVQVVQIVDYVKAGIYVYIPWIYFSIPIGIAVCIAIWKGPLIFMRLSNIIFGLIIFVYIITATYSFGDFRLSNIMPVMDCGSEALLTSTISFFPLSGDIIFFIMLGDKVENSPKTKRYFITGLVISYIAVFLIGLVYYGVFGNASHMSTFSVIKLTQYMTGKFVFERIDSYTTFMWLMSAFVKLCLSMYCVTAALNSVINIKNRRITTVFIVFALMIIPMLIWEDHGVFYSSLTGVFSYICGALQYGLPIVLLIFLSVKGKRIIDEKQNLV